MEFPEVGKNCDYTDCKQLEFLPLKCKCNKVYCPQHFNEHVQVCETTTSNIVTELKKIEGAYKCSFDGCKSTSVVPLICDKCQKHFCVEHRHINECKPIDPNKIVEIKNRILAPVQQFNEAKLLVDQEIDKKLASAKRKLKSVETVNKIQLMRIKNKATGLKSIPTTDRIYFSVKYPINISNKIAPVFVSKTWTVGRVIDALAQEFKIPNNNNQVNALKLRLFNAEDGHILTTNMSEKMEELLNQKSIMDGQSLALGYVADDSSIINL